jgi:two-component system, OmpR family, sensor kinase
MRSAFRVPELSLRARLLIALVVLAAVGLAALDLVSYRALHSYLYERVDQQLEAAITPVSMALADNLSPGEVPALERGGADRGGQGAARRLPPDGAGGGGGGPGPPAQLPPGTYGQLRGPDGEVLTQVLLDYGESGTSAPQVPAELATGRRGELSPVTVPARGEGSGSFRLAAVASPGHTVTVVAVPLGDTEATLDRLALIELVVSAAILIGLVLVAWWLVGVGLRPLRRMGEVAGEIAAGDLTRRVEPANERTEVGRLGLALNGMLSQIEQAFAEREAGERRLRRFLADASHELRTPLAAIRGYAELHNMGANRGAEQVDRAMGRIEAESSRMGTLVDDLLTLARIDEVRAPVRERVDLTRLLAEACEDAEAAAPDREITRRLAPGLEVEADPGQVRRVFDNLIRNAMVHTPAGTPIEVILERGGEEAVARVRDHGPGLPSRDTEAMFERFWRSSAARGREDGGAGLGLAIVAAIVHAHGGGVEAANAPHGGAEFTVRLPLAE